MIIYTTQSYKYFLETSGFMKMSVENGNVEFLKFPDGETYHQLKDDLRGKNVCLVGGTETDSSTLELYDMACHIAKQKPKQLIICIPYYGYSTMERAVKHGEVVKAKSRARLLSSIPGNNTFMFLDLHSEGIPHYLEGNATPIHLYAKNIIFSACKDLSNYKNDFVLGSTDAGRAKWVESLSKDMCVNCAIIIKRRSSGSETEVTGINADVKDKHVIIYDDMIRTGGSIIRAAKAYKDAGASKVSVVATHGVFSEGENVPKKLLDSGIDAVAVTNSHPNAMKYQDFSMRFKVYDISDLLFAYIPNYSN